MPPKKADDIIDGVGNLSMTPSEARLVKAIFDHMIDKPNTDWTKVAEDNNLKSAKGAKDRFRIVSAKHGWSTGLGNGTGSSSSSSFSPVKANKGMPEATVSGAGKKRPKKILPNKAATRKLRREREEEADGEEAAVVKEERIKEEEDSEQVDLTDEDMDTATI